LTPVVRARPFSAFGRPVHRSDMLPLIASRVLLKPFGPHLAMGALPSRESSMVAPGQPICIAAFAVVP
jgi:hypothetical protein